MDRCKSRLREAVRGALRPLTFFSTSIATLRTPIYQWREAVECTPWL